MSHWSRLPHQRRVRLRRVLVASSAVGVSVLALAARRSQPSTAQLRDELESVKGELNLARAQVERANSIIRSSTAYSVTADVARSIFDASLREGIDPELAFRLVRLESDFNAHAVSTAG